MVYPSPLVKKVEKCVRQWVVFFPCRPSVGYWGGVVGGCGGPGEVVDMWVGGGYVGGWFGGGGMGCGGRKNSLLACDSTCVTRTRAKSISHFDPFWAVSNGRNYTIFN